MLLEERPADGPGCIVARRWLDTLLASEDIDKTPHGGRGCTIAARAAKTRAEQRRPSGGRTVLQLADDAQRHVAHGVDGAHHLLLADDDIVQKAFELRRHARVDQSRIGLFEDAEQF